MADIIQKNVDKVGKQMLEGFGEKFNKDEVDRDIARIQEGKRVVREVKVGNCIVVLRNLKTKESDLAYAMSRRINGAGELLYNDNGMPLIDDAALGRLQLFLAISTISSRELTPFPEDFNDETSRKNFEGAIDDRREFIEGLPTTWVKPIVENNIILSQYVEKLSDPKILANF